MYSEEFKENNFKELIANDPERQREIARQGGLASGKTRQRKAIMNAYTKALLDASFRAEFVSPEEMHQFREWKKRKEKRQARKKKK